MGIDEILDELGRLDLTTFPYDHAKSLIHHMGKMGAVLVTLEPGKTIMRARANNEGERFTTPKQLS